MTINNQKKKNIKNIKKEAIVPLKNQELINELEQKYTLTSYLSKLAESSDPFKKEFSPPAVIAKIFWMKLHDWIDEEIKNTAAVATEDGGNPETGGQSTFTPAEIQFLRKIIYKFMDTSPGGRNHRPPKSVRQSQQLPAQAISSPIVPTPVAPPGVWAPGMVAYILDSSVLNNPELESGAPIQIRNIKDGVALVQSVHKPHVTASISLDNLSKTQEALNG